MKTAIITPYFNRPQLLEQSIKSTMKLDSDILHIIVDDGSKHPLKFPSTLDPNRYVFLRRERLEEDFQTSSNAINFGLDAILGDNGHIPEKQKNIDAITILHSDDLMLDFDAYVVEFEKHNTPAAIAHELRFTDWGHGNLRKVKKVNPTDIVQEQKHPRLTNHTLLWKKSFVQSLINENKKYNINGLMIPWIGYGEDFAVTKLTLKVLAESRQNLASIPLIAQMYRVHNASITASTDEAYQRKQRVIVSEMYFPTTGKHTSQSFSRAIYTNIYQPMKPTLRRLRHLVYHSQESLIVKNYLKHLDKLKPIQLNPIVA